MEGVPVTIGDDGVLGDEDAFIMPVEAAVRGITQHDGFFLDIPFANDEGVFGFLERRANTEFEFP